MFRLLNSGLPRDPEFPSNLEELGYFVNPDDEIRSISNSNAYFNYFITNNDRVNDAQREGFNGAVRKIVLGRLHSLDLKTLTLPLGTAEIDPHIPILVSTNLEHKKRVTILFYEHNQDLGILAHRVIGGPGGIDKGSAVNLVKYIQSQGDIGVILANLGQLRWWRRGGKAVSHTSWQALPRPSAVSAPPNFNLDLNTVPKNRTPEEHVECIFKQVLKYLCHFDARFDIIGVSDGATTTVKFLNEGQNWVTWGPRINAVALLASSHHQDEISNPEFAAWLRKRGRGYVTSSEDCDVAIAGPDGRGPHRAYGCPTFSLGEPCHTELLLTKGYRAIIAWFQQVAADPNYENEEVELSESGDSANCQDLEAFMPAPDGVDNSWRGSDGVLSDAWTPISNGSEISAVPVVDMQERGPDSEIQVTNWGGELNTQTADPRHISMDSAEVSNKT